VNRKKNLAADLALIFAGVALAFIVAEIAVRVTGLAKVSFYTWDAYRGWGLKPDTAGWQRDEGAGYVSVNSAGFRGPEWSIAKPPNTFRIAVLGDSFTEAPHVSYDRTFCAVTERELGGCSGMGGKRVQVMDFGVDAYGTAQELITLDRHAWQYSPDMIVLAFFSGNDLRNNSVTLEGDKCRPFYVFDGDRLVLGGPFERSRWFYLSCMMRFESRHSQVLNLLGDAKSDIRSKIKAMEAARGHPASPKPAARAAMPRVMPVADRQQPPVMHEEGIEDNIYRPPTTPVWQNAWRVTEGIITMMARDAAAHHVPLLVVTLANPPQVYPSTAVRASYMHLYGSTDIFYPDERIKALGEREGFEVLNLAPPMQAYADEHHVFLAGFKNTKMGIGHWNAAGHQLAGDLIARKICEMLSAGTHEAAAH
jgi:hypothetical protein